MKCLYFRPNLDYRPTLFNPFNHFNLPDDLYKFLPCIKGMSNGQRTEQYLKHLKVYLKKIVSEID